MLTVSLRVIEGIDMNKKELFNLQEHELDTNYELAVFLDSVFKKLTLEALYSVNTLLDDYPFMGSEWQAANKCQREILKLFPKDLLGDFNQESEF